MFHVIGSVGGKIGVLDTEDGVIEWLPKDEVIKAVKLGISISGYESGDKFVRSRCTVTPDKCNWSPSGNIFSPGSKFQLEVKKRDEGVEAGNFKLKVGNKVLKGSFTDSKQTPMVDLLFYGCVTVLLPRETFLKLR